MILPPNLKKGFDIEFAINAGRQFPTVKRPSYVPYNTLDFTIFMQVFH